MTLVIGLKWATEHGEAVLMTSDTKATTSLGIAYEMKKIYPILSDDDKAIAVAGGAGDAAFIKQGVRLAEKVLLAYAEKQYPVPQDTFEGAASEIESKLVTRLGELRRKGIEPSFQMGLGSVDLDGRASMYVFNSMGLVEAVHDNPGYAIIGSGMITGGMLLLKMIGYESSLELGLVSAFIIDSVSEIDTSVGPFAGESYFMRVKVDGGQKSIAFGPLTDEAVLEYKKKIGARRELLKKLWKLSDAHGEEAVRRCLSKVHD
jgi:20S proteasome alpha/beta subunit